MSQARKLLERYKSNRGIIESGGDNGGKPVNEAEYPLSLIQNPTGTWSFVGRVPVKLGWIKKDGSELDDATADKLVGASNPAMIAKSRSFKSESEALKAAKDMGLKVSQVIANKNVAESREPKDKDYYFTEIRIGSTDAYSKILALDKKFIGTKDYMGLAYFWGQAYKFYLRDCKIDDRVEIHDQFVSKKLDLEGESPEHEAILKSVLKNFK